MNSFTHKLKQKGALWPFVIMVGVMVVGLVPILTLSFYTRAGADDYSYAAVFVRPAVEAGGNIFDILGAAWQTTWYYFNTWQGLYSSAFVLSLQPGSFGNNLYWVTTWILLGLTACGFMALTRAFCKHILRSDSKAWIGISLITWFFFVQTMPNLYEGLYWFDGAFDYLFFWCLFMFACTFVINYLVASTGRSRAIWLCLTTALTIIVAGGNHITTLFLLVVLFFCCIYEARARRRAWLLIPLIVGLICFYCVLKAPGTAIRSEALGLESGNLAATAKHVAKSLGHGAWWLANLMSGWFSLSTLAYFVAVAPFVIAVCKRAQLNITLHASFWAWLFAGFAFMYWIGLSVLVYALGDAGAGRVHDMLYATLTTFFEAIALFVAYALCKRPESEAHTTRLNFSANPAYASWIATLGLLVLVFAFNSPLGFHRSSWAQAYDDIASGSAHTYAQEMDERDALIQASNEDVVVVPARTAYPPCITNNLDVTDDPTYWINKAVADYYHKEGVVVLPAPDAEDNPQAE